MKALGPPATITIDTGFTGGTFALLLTGTDKNGGFDVKSLKAGVCDVVVVTQPKKIKPTGTFFTGYRISPGTGQHVAGYRFGEKPIA